MEIITGIDQGSDEWLELRLGKVTASRVKDVLSKGRGNAPSKTREAYMLDLAAEIISSERQESFTNKYMEWGNACEPQARAMYEFKNDVDVDQVAFIKHDKWLGVSPDGLIGDCGMLEIKCPKTTTQIARYLNGEFPSVYKSQVQCQLFVAERDWNDFVSFDPRIKGKSSYFEIRVYRDEKYIVEMKNAIDIFVDELNELLEKLK